MLFNVEKKNTPTQDEILKLLESSDDKVEHSSSFFQFFVTDEGEGAEVGCFTDARWRAHAKDSHDRDPILHQHRSS